MTKTGPSGLAAGLAAAIAMALMASGPLKAQTVAPVAATAQAGQDEITRGPVTRLPLPRYVTLKTSEGNARRGPGLAHRIDWVFKHPGMPLRVTAEHENWRRIEDAEGAGGWVHYSLLSGARSVLVTEDLANMHAKPDARSPVVARAAAGVVARVMECRGDWCRIQRYGRRGWISTAALWGVAPGEAID